MEPVQLRRPLRNIGIRHTVTDSDLRLRAPLARAQRADFEDVSPATAVAVLADSLVDIVADRCPPDVEPTLTGMRLDPPHLHRSDSLGPVILGVKQFSGGQHDGVDGHPGGDLRREGPRVYRSPPSGNGSTGITYPAVPQPASVASTARTIRSRSPCRGVVSKASIA